ncbi:MAG: xanthine dehydrogenase family protein molybdopterin-binding subunit [Nitrososphaerales archaeon]|nr:xanthine dehydrogenase family protein molybdopterin-binding subunit [Nitrososphaerales archaeon]
MSKEEFKWVGKPVPRRDAHEKASGATKYASDMSLPGMLWAGVLRSKHPHALIKRIDTSKAKALAGVAAVLTHEDVPGSNRYGVFLRDRPVLCDGEVRYEGDAVALVVAESVEKMDEALALIEVEYEPLPAVTDPLQALRPDSAKVHENGNVCRKTRISIGDVEAGSKRAAVVVENTYRAGSAIHAYLEPEAGVAYLDKEGRVNLVVGGQGPYKDRSEICETLGLPEERVRVVTPPVGGGFGGKDDVLVQLHLALAVLKTGRPVKMTWTREESCIAGLKRHPGIIKMKTAAESDGSLIANKVEIVYDTGAYAGLGPAVLDVAIENCSGPYRIPNIDVEATLVYTNNHVASAFRGFGAPQVMFAIESQMDILAERLGLDPIELRLRNALRKGDIGPFKNKLEGGVGIYEALEKARKHELWSNKTRYGSGDRPWVRRGVGVGAAIKGFTLGAVPDKGSAKIEVTGDGRFLVKVSTAEIGQGMTTVFAQIAAEALECNLDDVSVLCADTLQTPDTSVTSASRSTYLGGNAIILAARKMLDTFVELVGEEFNEPTGDLQAGSSEVVSMKTGRKISYTKIAEKIRSRALTAEFVGTFDVPRVEPIPGSLEIPHLFYMFSCALALVEVDTLTGAVKVIKLVCLPDAGRVINPQTFEGQIEGAAVQGVGYAIMEEAKIEGGLLKTSNFSTYLIPTVKDAPEIEVIAVESVENTGPYGAKGVGEIGLVPIAPAIINAIYNATGTRLYEIPATPERVYWALKRKVVPSVLTQGSSDTPVDSTYNSCVGSAPQSQGQA